MTFTLTCFLGLLLGLLCLADNDKGSRSICNLKHDSGLCYAYIPSFYYDADTGTCKQFIYGGCGGNENRFSTEKECMDRCGSGRRGGGAEHQDVVSTPEPAKPYSSSICNQPKKVGPCEALIGRYWFNQATGQCEHFFFGGCQQNDNNFVNKEECEKSCIVKSKDSSPTEVCNQAKQPGQCSEQITRYYFNNATGKCENFVYTGCGGNENNFLYSFECERRCLGENVIGDVCSLDSYAGLCLAYIPRYFFNKQKGECEEFIFGGCDGNHNNFGKKEECEQYCKKGNPSPQTGQLVDVCSLHKETGPCKAAMPRFYFNKQTGECEQFIYGGCSGNANNFKKKDDCERACKQGSSQ